MVISTEVSQASPAHRPGDRPDLPFNPSSAEHRAIEQQYPSCDGQPMAENTEHFDWIAKFKANLELLFAQDPQVFVAGDLLWYPVEGDPKQRQAPDTMVVFGRPKGPRSSYLQWREAGIAPQVVVEILSPGNRFGEMLKKFQFYDRFGVEEYYLYDYGRNELTVWVRSPETSQLAEVEFGQTWTSPRTAVQFHLSADRLALIRPDGRPFLSFVELDQERQAAVDLASQERQRAEQERQRTEQERQRAEQERQRAEQERQRADRLAALLRAQGINPDQL